MNIRIQQKVVGILLLFYGLLCDAVPETDSAKSPTSQDARFFSSLLGKHAKRHGYTRIDFSKLLREDVIERTGETGAGTASISNQFSIRLFDDVVVVATFEKVDQSHGYAWFGIPIRPHEGKVVFSIHGDEVIGKIDIDFDQYVIQGRMDDELLVTEIDPTSFSAGEPIDEPMAHAERSLATRKIEHSPMPHSSIATTVDLLVVWTSAATNLTGFDPGPPYAPVAFINSIVADMNSGFADSGVDATVRVVGYAPSSYIEQTDISQSAWTKVRDGMQAGTGVSGQSTVFSTLPVLRNQYAADIVFLLINGDSMPAACGVSYSWATASPDSTLAFGVLDVGCAIGDRTFNHEVGHTLGGRHDNDAKSAPFAYSHGYTNSNPDFRTTMGVKDISSGTCAVSGCPRINRWSDPFSSYSGIPLGLIGSNDMVQTLGSTVSAVAGYRAAASLTKPGAPPAFFGDTCPANPTRRNLTWTSPGGTVGWYEIQSANSAAFSPATLFYRGPGTYTQSIWNGPAYFRVRACNAAGCGAYIAITWRSPPVC